MVEISQSEIALHSGHVTCESCLLLVFYINQCFVLHVHNGLHYCLTWSTASFPNVSGYLHCIKSFHLFESNRIERAIFVFYYHLFVNIWINKKGRERCSTIICKLKPWYRSFCVIQLFTRYIMPIAWKEGTLACYCIIWSM